MSNVNKALARAPGYSTAADALGVQLEAMPLRAMITIRGDLADATLVNAVEAVSGCTIPAVRKATFAGENSLLWMSPDELMLFGSYTEADDLVTSLNDKAGGAHMLAVNVSDARAVFRLSGEKARYALGKGAPIDLARGHFGAGDIRRTRIATVATGIVMTAEMPDTFEVFCFRSYGTYLWNWLISACDKDALSDLG